jgi:RNA polymerase sigma-70 factor (ECF subfamily)
MGETPIDDRELRLLMTQYQRANPDALEELIRRISPPLLRYFAWSSQAWSQAGRNDAEDLLQECWIRIHHARHTYRSTEPVMPWIYAIARHTRLDAYRKRRRLESREVLVATFPERFEQTAPETASQPDAFEHLVASLPESQREVIVMLKVSGMSLEEVARATSSTVGAVKQKAHRAYATLRRALGKARKDAK